MSDFLSFLKSDSFKLQEVDAPVKRQGGAKEWNPAPHFFGIRVWKDGSVFPSEALVNQLNLEYPDATIEVKVKEYEVPAGATEEEQAALLKKNQQRVYTYLAESFGLDIIDTDKWSQYPKGAPRGICVAVTPWTEPKVDLFGECRYNQETGKPMTSVMDQGATTFGANVLLPLLKEVYNLELNDEREFVDLQISTEVELVSLTKAPFVLLPKVITRGEDRGKPDYIRRENVVVYPMLPVLATVAAAEAENDTTADPTPEPESNGSEYVPMNTAEA